MRWKLRREGCLKAPDLIDKMPLTCCGESGGPHGLAYSPSPRVHISMTQPVRHGKMLMETPVEVARLSCSDGKRIVHKGKQQSPNGPMKQKLSLAQCIWPNIEDRLVASPALLEREPFLGVAAALDLSNVQQ